MMIQSSSTPKVIYDRDVDVLYLKYATNKNATAREIGANIIAYFDDTTGLPTTITILDYIHLENTRPSWRNELPIFIDFDRDVKPFI